MLLKAVYCTLHCSYQYQSRIFCVAAGAVFASCGRVYPKYSYESLLLDIFLLKGLLMMEIKPELSDPFLHSKGVIVVVSEEL